jgi:hypothetical protein
MLFVVIIISFDSCFPWGNGEANEEEAIMLKQTVIAGVLALISIGPAAAQSASGTTQAQGTTAAPATMTTVEACESQARHIASTNKVLGANYNADRVHNDCMASNTANFASSK